MNSTIIMPIQHNMVLSSWNNLHILFLRLLAFHTFVLDDLPVCKHNLIWPH